MRHQTNELVVDNCSGSLIVERETKKNRAGGSSNLHSRVAKAISEIEAEMKNIGYWMADPLPPAAFDFNEAFAMDTMAFSQWLQFVFIPRVKFSSEQD